MAATPQPVPDAQALAPVCPRTMTRCECAGVSFQEVARVMASQHLSADQAARRTGCGQTCTACLPDLRLYLSGE